MRTRKRRSRQKPRINPRRIGITPDDLDDDLPTIHAAALTAARSKKLVHLDIAELNPSLDIDNRTARTAARLIDDIVRAHENTRT